MKRKEAIIRYLGHVGWADREQTSQAIKASPNLTSVKLTELKRVAIVRNVEWPDGSKVWVLTKEGADRFDYYRKRDSQRGPATTL